MGDVPGDALAGLDRFGGVCPQGFTLGYPMARFQRCAAISPALLPDKETSNQGPVHMNRNGRKQKTIANSP